MIIGSHVSFNKDKQLLGSVLESISYGSNAFMFYTGAPQNTIRIPLDASLRDSAYKLMRDNDISINDVIVHAPYIINMANPNNFDFNVSFLKQEIDRCIFLGIKKLVIHPGSHVNNGIELGLKTIIKVLNAALNKDTNIIICLEMMSGKGSECGTNFKDMKYIIDNVIYNDKLMICFDTCHMNDYGYDISKFDDILESFDKELGLNKLGCIHVNDSKNERGIKKDRHANIGYGYIGYDNLLKVIYNERIKSVPKILETPWIDDYPPYKFEIEMIKSKKFNDKLEDTVINYYKS